MTSHPFAADDSGVELLLKWWGGEVVSMWRKDPSFLTPLETIGKGRIIEIAVLWPLPESMEAIRVQKQFW
jgi:hypothetical protein